MQEKSTLIDVGRGVKMTESINVKNGLLIGECIFMALSHQGILDIYADRNIVQFTDLNDNKRVEIDIEG